MVARCVLEIDGAGECSLGADDVVIGASTFKLAVALELYCRAASDGLDVNQRIAFQADRSIASKAPPREAAMMMMMAVSDNAAADALIDLLGAETITTRLHQVGATHTTVRPGVQAEVRAITAELDPYAVAAGFDGWHDLYARHSSPAGLSGQQQQRLSAVTIPDNVSSQGRGAPTTARDMAVLVRAIWRDEAGPPTACAQVRELMSHQVGQRLARAFPDRADISVAAKVAAFPGSFATMSVRSAYRRDGTPPQCSPARITRSPPTTPSTPLSGRRQPQPSNACNAQRADSGRLRWPATKDRVSGLQAATSQPEMPCLDRLRGSLS